MCAARYVNMYSHRYLYLRSSIQNHALPRPAVRFPVCRRCWCRGARLSPFAWKLSAYRPGTRRSSAESGSAPGWSRCPPQSPAASPHTMNFPICRDREKEEGKMSFSRVLQYYESSASKTQRFLSLFCRNTLWHMGSNVQLKLYMVSAKFVLCKHQTFPKNLRKTKALYWPYFESDKKMVER